MNISDKQKYLELLSQTYYNMNQACTEIINLQAMLNLPKGTEHFVSDIHGEYEAFDHVLRNASGVIKDYINELFGTTIREQEKRALEVLIYYPRNKIKDIQKNEKDMDDWYKINLFRLIRICKRVSSKYTRSKVRKALPAEFAYILEELIHEDADRIHKQEYYNQIIDTIISLNKSTDFIIAISNVIQCLAIDHLHIIGDIFDRGPAADLILDTLIKYHSVDVQWGNHDISWMGAASGSLGCICNVIRIAARYNNLRTIEEGYGINLVPLATFAMEYYKDDPCTQFYCTETSNSHHTDKELALMAKMHKAICIIQFKVEAEIIARNPNFHMEDRNLLHLIDLEKKSITIKGKTYILVDTYFNTVNPENPYALTEEEKEVIEKIKMSFMNCAKLQEHIRFLFNKGSMYKIYNSHLLFHGCIPLKEDGSFKVVELFDKKLYGIELFNEIDKIVRNGFFMPDNSLEKQKGLDLMWYLWCGSDSPLYGKDKMTTFERYFINDKELWEETKDPYYTLRNEEKICVQILNNFGLNKSNARIINGHVPVEVNKGESPIKAGGRLLVIDGGFAKAYQKVTGIAGYTLIYNSKGLVLTAHEPFTSMDEIIQNNLDVVSNTSYIEYNEKRIQVGDTDKGHEIKERIKDLTDLLNAYAKGMIKEKK